VNISYAIENSLFRIKRKFMAFLETARYSFGTKGESCHFVIVSCERNAGGFALKCLDTVYNQRYDRRKVEHIFIDDASDDGTHEKISEWLGRHPDHTVRYIRNDVRKGGTANTIYGMGLAAVDSIVIELNGDDWLPDSRVLDFLSRVYADPFVWMTYNSLRIHNGPPVEWAKGFSREIIDSNSFRDQEEWCACHLHTFRKRLFDHVDSASFIDPETGRYWECADDQALYLSLLELAGKHSRHLNRITCVYNFWEASHSFQDSRKSIETATRIRNMSRYQPLEQL
jgi:glycosyltransferase involved in cell wall biosynthesis